MLAQRTRTSLWVAVVLTGISTGLAASALTRLLALVQHIVWGGSGLDLLQVASQSAPARHVLLLLGAGLLTAAAQLLLTRLSSGNSIDITAAIWFHSGRLPALRTLGTAILSVFIVGMGAPLGREGAPKQAGAGRLRRRCWDGGGVRRPAGRCIVCARSVAWGSGPALRPARPRHLAGRDRRVLGISSRHAHLSHPRVPGLAFQRRLGTLGRARRRAGVGGLCPGRRLGRWSQTSRLVPVLAPVAALGVVGAVSIPFPQRLGNGRDVTELAFIGQISPTLLAALFILRPAATVLCFGSGAPGGLFTPSLALGAMLGGLLGVPWTWLWPGVPPGLFAFLGAAALLAATTQGPISTIVLMMELTGYARGAIVPLLLAVSTATLVARLIEPRSIYDARLSDALLRARQQARDHPSEEPSPT